MKDIYEILKLLKEEFRCFEVDLCLAQVYEQEGDEIGKEVFHVVLFSELCENPIEVRLPTDQESLELFDVKSLCVNLMFELSCQGEVTHDIYEFGSETIH